MNWARLAPGVRAGLLRWVGGGGHLLIDSAPLSAGAGTAIDGLPAEWQPAAARRGRVAARGSARCASPATP